MIQAKDEQYILKKYERTSLGGVPFEVWIVKPPAARVTLVAYTNNALQAMARTTIAYSGEYSSSFSPSSDEMEKAFKDIVSTKLQTPMEMIHTLWLLNDVTRAFTHQLVRYRIGTAFVQESMRFLGRKNVFKVLMSGNTSWKLLGQYGDANANSVQTYMDLLDEGVTSEDARGVLPTNILTHIYFDCSLRTLAMMTTQRLCCQAQGIWTPIIIEFRKQVRGRLGAEIADLLKAPVELGNPCGYGASFDRPCIWKNGIKET